MLQADCQARKRYHSLVDSAAHLTHICPAARYNSESLEYCESH